jgi:hypothetical protein
MVSIGDLGELDHIRPASHDSTTAGLHHRKISTLKGFADHFPYRFQAESPPSMPVSAKMAGT